MTKQEIIEQVAHRTGIEKTATRAIIEEAISVVSENLSSGRAIYIRGLFTLAPIIRKEKVARNITKKTSIIIPQHYAPHAKFAPIIKEKMKHLKSTSKK